MNIMKSLRLTGFYFKNMLKYIRRGGVVYYKVANLEPDNRFTGKTVLITGGSSGFGLQMAKDFVQEGAEVIITGRSLDKLIQASGQIGSDKIKIMQWDVSNLDILKEKFHEAVGLFGKIDIFINNAGRYSSVHSLDTTVEDWDNVINTDLRGPFFLAKEEGIYLKSVYAQLGGG